jgi:hypothetical protein
MLLQVPQRLASYAAAAGPLSDWLCRFSTLRRPLDGAAQLGEVLAGASDVAAGILLAKKAAQAGKAAAEAAHRAKESAEKVRPQLPRFCACSGFTAVVKLKACCGWVRTHLSFCCFGRDCGCVASRAVGQSLHPLFEPTRV